MYPEWLYEAFVQLRKQIYKLRTRKQHAKYSQIEQNRKVYTTFGRFYDEAHGHIYDCNLDLTVQEVFDDMLDKSQGKHGLKVYIF